MLKTWVERFLFASRFLLTPLYLALAVSLLALLFKTAMHLWALFSQILTLNDEGVLLTELAIVDMTLTASLVVIVFLSGYTNFVAPVLMRENDGRPHWIAEIDFSELKLKLMASIVAISGIKLLEGFMDISHESDRELFWLVAIHLTFVASTLLLADLRQVRPPDAHHARPRRPGTRERSGSPRPLEPRRGVAIHGAVGRRLRAREPAPFPVPN